MCIILKKCCYCLPLAVGVIVLAILHGILGVFFTLQGLYFLQNEQLGMALFAFVIVLLSVVLSVCVILGMITKKARLIFIAVIAGVIFVIIAILFLILYIISRREDDDWFFVTLVVFIIIYTLYIYLLIVMNSYRAGIGGGAW